MTDGLVALASFAFSGALLFNSALLWHLLGRIERRITECVEATIATLPPELQDEWANEWRAELATMISAPATAGLFARGLRRSASDLLADRAPASAGTGGRMRSNSPQIASTLIGRVAQRRTAADADVVVALRLSMPFLRFANDGLAGGLVMNFWCVVFVGGVTAFALEVVGGVDAFKLAFNVMVVFGVIVILVGLFANVVAWVVGSLITPRR